jgi:hypothetical protein
MTDKADELAELKAKVAALEAAQPKPQPTREEQERAAAEHRDWVHQMRERQANSWMPPSAVHEMASHPCNQVMGGVINDRHAPNTPAMIPRTNQQPTADRGASSTPGYVEARPIGVPGGERTQELIERMANAALPHGPEWGKGKRKR